MSYLWVGRAGVQMSHVAFLGSFVHWSKGKGNSSYHPRVRVHETGENPLPLLLPPSPGTSVSPGTSTPTWRRRIKTEFEPHQDWTMLCRWSHEGGLLWLPAGASRSCCMEAALEETNTGLSAPLMSCKIQVDCTFTQFSYWVRLKLPNRVNRPSFTDLKIKCNTPSYISTFLF